MFYFDIRKESIIITIIITAIYKKEVYSILLLVFFPF